MGYTNPTSDLKMSDVQLLLISTAAVNSKSQYDAGGANVMSVTEEIIFTPFLTLVKFNSWCHVKFLDNLIGLMLTNADEVHLSWTWESTPASLQHSQCNAGTSVILWTEDITNAYKCHIVMSSINEYYKQLEYTVYCQCSIYSINETIRYCNIKWWTQIIHARVHKSLAMTVYEPQYTWLSWQAKVAASPV